MNAMSESDETFGIMLIALGAMIIILGLLVWTSTKPVPLEIEYTKDSYKYSLSYPELEALRMSGYAELSLILSNLIEGSAIFVIFCGGLRLIWSGLHLYPFWNHLRPYFRSGNVKRVE